jgi:toxin ParE1/3/4
MKARYTAAAHAEIDEIYLYIAKDNRSAADRVINQIEHTIELIEKSPRIGRLKYRQSVYMVPVRRYPQYLLFYTIEGDEIVILNVRHGARQRPWEEDR